MMIMMMMMMMMTPFVNGQRTKRRRIVASMEKVEKSYAFIGGGVWKFQFQISRYLFHSLTWSLNANGRFAILSVKLHHRFISSLLLPVRPLNPQIVDSKMGTASERESTRQFFPTKRLGETVDKLRVRFGQSSAHREHQKNERGKERKKSPGTSK